jgi:hypothetical protein
MTKVTATYKEDVFHEGAFVAPKDKPNQVYMVTCIAQKYEDNQEGRFWAIDLTGSRISGGNYLKDLFIPFRGTIHIEVG